MRTLTLWDVPVTPCREWQGGRARNGYGKRYVKGTGRAHHRTEYIHRWVWEQINGPVPADKYVMHLCDNPACFRYDHLTLGSAADNSADMVAKGRQKGGPNAPHHSWPSGHRKPGRR